VRPRRSAILLSAAALAASAPPAVAAQQVSVQFAAFAPSAVDALPGEAVEWSNASVRTHTVTGAAFASGDVVPGATFAWTAAALPGVYAYHCTIHPQMTGEIDVRRVTLGVLPPMAVAAGTRVELTGRTADPLAPVRIERDRGAGFAQVAVAMADPAGAWRAAVVATASADYRAVSAADASEVRRLLVSDRHITIRAVRRGVAVSVTPADPYGRVLLEQRLRERFGWWPVARARLDAASHARFVLPRARGATARVVLTLPDGATPLAYSRVMRVRSRS
jgi:plastocyanin